MIQLEVPKLACNACVNTITNVIQGIDATAKVDANTKTKIVNVQTDKSEDEIRKAVASVGYPARHQ
jgi:copper chaperone